MRVRFGAAELEALERTTGGDAAYPPGVAKAFRRLMQAIRAAEDERPLRSMKSLRFEKLQGKRAHQRSMRLNDQWRLILEFDGDGKDKTVVVVAIEDYH